MTKPQLPRPVRRGGFEVAVICAQRQEIDAVKATLDEQWDDGPYGKGDGDPNKYTFGRVGRSAVVLTLLPGTGKEHAASGSAYFHTSFPNIKLCLLVGTCAASPKDQEDNDVFLGDVLISTGLVQSDFGRHWSNGIARYNTISDNFGRPSKEIRSLLVKLQTTRTNKVLTTETALALAELAQMAERWRFPGREKDILFRENCQHKHRPPGSCQSCDRGENCGMARNASCETLQCSVVEDVERQGFREDTNPSIHFGAFSTSDEVICSSLHRDDVVAADRVIAFETEGAGVWDNFPTVIVKGAYYYADSHKNEIFCLYAAATAAACAKAFLAQWESGRSSPSGQASSVSSPSSAFGITHNYSGDFRAEKIFQGMTITSSGTITF